MATLLISESFLSFTKASKAQILNFPDEVTAISNEKSIILSGKENSLWALGDLSVELKNLIDGMSVFISSPGIELNSVTLKWKLKNSLKGVITKCPMLSGYCFLSFAVMHHCFVMQ